MDADVIVVGAGIVGAACAYELAQRGLRVLVLDDQRTGATQQGMGHLVVMDDNPAELALSIASLAVWKEWLTRMDASCGYANSGTLWIATDQEEMQAAQEKQSRLHGAGVACEMVGASELGQLEPALKPGLQGALKVPGDGVVYAPRATHWLLSAAHHPIQCIQATVLALDSTEVHLSDGRKLKAPAVVVAAGMWSAALCPDLPLQAKKGHLAITVPYPGMVKHQLVELGYVKSAHSQAGSSVAFNVQPRPTGQLLIGSSRQFDSTDNNIEPDMLARMLARAVAYMPSLSQVQVLRCWTGLRAASPDGLPLIGPHPNHPHLWLAVGHEGLGVTTATGTAVLIADSIVATLGHGNAKASGHYSHPPLSGQAYLPARLLARL